MNVVVDYNLASTRTIVVTLVMTNLHQLYQRLCCDDTMGTSYCRQSSTTTNSACTENNRSNMRTIASYTTHHLPLPNPHMLCHLSTILSANDQIQEGVYTSTVMRQPMLLLWMVMYRLHPGQSRSSIGIVALLEACCYVMSTPILPV